MAAEYVQTPFMAFDGPGPFDRDPVFAYLDQLEGQPPSSLQSAFEAAFDEVLNGGAARHAPVELLSMLGFDKTSIAQGYADVDESVWAWACAEIVVLALDETWGHSIPEPFRKMANGLPHPRRLVSKAVSALEVVGDSMRSELGSLLRESEHVLSLQRISDLRTKLGRYQLRSV